jgi:dCMP deaminase|tara:strand:+ start:3928 stop:4491 length:564 start_codon:yes stop_codon:yes gene_type:complete
MGKDSNREINLKRVRPTWDERFMFEALWAATRSSCLKLHTGAVVVQDKRSIASGYNGAAPGIESSLELGYCSKDRAGIDFDDKGKGVCIGTHAEINAMSQIGRKDLIGASLYTLCFPCSPCAKQIAGNGIREVYFSAHYGEPNLLVYKMFKQAGIEITQLEIDVNRSFEIIKGIWRPEDMKLFNNED